MTFGLIEHMQSPPTTLYVRLML